MKKSTKDKSNPQLEGNSGTVVWTRQNDGRYTRAGRLPAGTKRVGLQIMQLHNGLWEDSFISRKTDEAIAIVESTILLKCMVCHAYRLLPSNLRHAMSEEAKAKLRVINQPRRPTRQTERK